MPIQAAQWLAKNAPSYQIQPASKASEQTKGTSSPKARFVVISNSHAGARKATELWEDVVAPLLDYALPPSVVFDGKVLHTASAGDGERIGRELRKAQQEQHAAAQRLVLLVLGGDGTVHEVLNGLLLDENGNKQALAESAELVLIPAGTANALYYHTFPPESPSFPLETPTSAFYSLLSFLQNGSATSSSDHLQPITLALNTLPATATPSPSKRVLTTVVSSAALHACLLHDAEELRETHPGLERFKIAAQQNVQRWWEGTLKLEGNVRVYSPAKREWVPANAGAASETPSTLEGPFAYLVTALVSRFEPSFVVAPFRTASHPLSPSNEVASIDVICIRPTRHAPTSRLVQAGQEKEARDAWVQRIWEVTGGMYAGGKHVDQRYEEGEIAPLGEGELTDAVVEVYRCERLRWLPACTKDDLKSRLVCLDGAIYDLGTSASSAADGADATDTALQGLSVEALRGGEGISIWS
ncbi:hypothetical protein JCM10908_001853 [Rhodotorula pacifica]|uniref:acylglycerol kinase family protein n=1 Tax=Rhodotorula pacifica TaxID=1495444 RepID=UPI003171C05E